MPLVRLSRLLWLSCLVLLSTACTGTETGNPSADSTLSLRARSSDPSRVTIGTDAGRVRVDAIWVSLSEIALGACDADAAERIGPLVQNLLAPPAPQRFERERERYCTLTTSYAAAGAEPAAGAPPELAGRSVVVLGRNSDGASFRLASAQTAAVSLSVEPPGFAVDDATHALILAFDLAAWFASVDLALATPEPDGTIRIDEQRNPALLAHFESGVTTSTSLHHDLDHDGELDPDEDVPIAH